MGAGMRAATLTSVMAFVAACGGGGGGGSVVNTGPSAIEAPLSSFAEVAPNQTVVMEGKSVGMTGTVTGSSGAHTVTSANASPIGDASVKFSYDGSKNLSAITIHTSQGSFTFDRIPAGRTAICTGSGACTAENATMSIVVVDPVIAGWNYQSFGVWGTDMGPSTWMLGVVSAGTATSPQALPTTGGAHFNGRAVGMYIDPAGTAYATNAKIEANVSFQARSITFWTFDSRTIKNGVETANGALNFAGTLSYAPGVNSFSGSVSTSDNQMSGQAAGRFYGPVGQEMGGVYSLSGSGVSRMLGGFGAKETARTPH
jgi:hypothetical protein